MATVRLTSNTSKEYPCVNCGSDGNIVREGDNPRLKCNSCGFLYDGVDSLAAKSAGQIPDEAPKLADPEPEHLLDTPAQAERAPRLDAGGSERPPRPEGFVVTVAPRNPKYLLLAKDRKGYDYATEKNLEEKVVQWVAAKKRFDLYELTPKKVDTKVHIN